MSSKNQNQHSVKVPRLYKVASNILKTFHDGKGSVKTLVYEVNKSGDRPGRIVLSSTNAMWTVIDNFKQTVIDTFGWRLYPARVGTRLRPFLENIFLEKFLEKYNFLEKFSRNSRRKKSKFKLVFFYTFGILTTKMYTKLASIEIMMKYYQNIALPTRINNRTLNIVNVKKNLLRCIRKSKSLAKYIHVKTNKNQKWAEFGIFLWKTSKNVKNEVKIQKLLKSVFSNFSNFSKIISREIQEFSFFEILEKLFSRRTQSSRNSLLRE
jgi:hypothetical protein